MRINTNIAALRSSYHLQSSDSKLAESLERLSSGNKLIDIRDNPVGAAMSVKMKAQIRNLDRASQNTSDGISVVETAESALAEMQSMVQRINELAVQGASETNTDEDRANIMKEIDQIREEITRVSTDTDFNTKTLLNGTLERKTYTSQTYAKVTYASSDVPAGTYRIAYTDSTAAQAEVTTGMITAGSLPAGTIKLNGASIEIKEGDTLTEIYEKFKEAGEKTGLDVTYTGDLNGSASFTFTQTEYGSDYTVNISTSEELAGALGLSGKEVSVAGADGTAILDTADPSKFNTSATCTISGRTITIRDFNGFEMEIEMKDGVPQNATIIEIGVTDIGAMVIQVGANEYQELDVEIPRIDSETLGLDKIRGYTAEGCGNAITISANAISRISAVRSSLGAYQNRMEHTVATLEVTEENMTASLSRIEDVDMAEEMTSYTTYNVMTQAATSMLAQANQLPDKVLQLLQQ